MGVPALPEAEDRRQPDRDWVGRRGDLSGSQFLRKYSLDDNNALVEINKAQQALAQANDIQEILDLRDKAASFVLFANAQGFKEAAQEAKIFQLNAERKAGMWLAENVTHGGNPKTFQDERSTPLPEGVDYNESHRWQLQASVPEETFNEWVDECLTTGKEITASGLQRIGRLLRIGENEQPELPQGKYRVIYADPPWQYGDKLIDGYGPAEHHYTTMTLAELMNLPVYDLSLESSVLFLWATAPMIREALDLANAWGFEYKAQFIWDKVRHNYGHYNSVRHELLLLCTRGSCLPDNNILIDSVQIIERNDKHSSKPNEFRAIIEGLYKVGPYIELFAREKIAGWECWGNEL